MRRLKKFGKLAVWPKRSVCKDAAKEGALAKLIRTVQKNTFT